MTIEEIPETILRLFRNKEVMKSLGEDEDFFDLGVSSLTIVELQIAVESALDIEVPTSELMTAPTIKQWIALYTERAALLS